MANKRVKTDKYIIYSGHCIDAMRRLPANYFHSCVSDPPYGLSKEPDIREVMQHWLNDKHYKHKANGFMGKGWDSFVPGPEYWREVYRVLKPGAYCLVFAGTRTYDLMTIALRFAGFEIRDCIRSLQDTEDYPAWAYGTGFPKSLDVSKALSKRADPDLVRTIKLWLAEQFACCGKPKSQINRECGFTASDYLKTEAGQDAGGRATWHLLLPYGKKWQILKRVVGFDDTYDEEIALYGRIIAQTSRPKDNDRVYGKYSGVVTDYEQHEAAKQWEGWGTALKPAWEPIIVARKPLAGTVAENVLKHGTGALNIGACRVSTGDNLNGGAYAKNGGRTESQSLRTGSGMNQPGKTANRDFKQPAGRWPANMVHDGSDAVVSQFPLTAPSKSGGGASDKAFGLLNDDNWKAKMMQRTGHDDNGGTAARFFYTAKASKSDRGEGNDHPTVKPTALMRYLVRLVTPPNGKCLDPFMGSGTTGVACMKEGFRFVGVELQPEYFSIAKGRVKKAALHCLKKLF